MTSTRPPDLHVQHLAQLEAAAADPAHPNHEAAVWVLRRRRELLLDPFASQLGALSRAISEYRALQTEGSQA